MTQPSGSWKAEVFDRLYARDPDPWKFSASRYEQQKYQASIDILGGRQFRSGLEIGCSIGVLTRRLAACCDRLLAIDFAAAALVQAREACADLPHVEFVQAAIPGGFPAGEFDLIVLSEVLYFLDPSDIRATAKRAMEGLAPDGLLLLVNYLGATDSPTTGDDAATIFAAACAPDIIPMRRLRTDRYRLEVLGPAGPPATR